MIARTSIVERTVDRVLGRGPVATIVTRAWSGHRLAVLGYHGVDDADRFADHMRWLVQHRRPVSLDDVIAAAQGRQSLPDRAALVTFDDGAPSVFECGLPVMRDLGVPGVVFVVADLVDSDRPLWWDEVMSLTAAGARAQAHPGLAGRPLVDALKYGDDTVRVDAIEELRQAGAHPPPRRAQLSADQLRSFESAGVAVGNHTRTHPSLTRCSLEKVTAEIVGAHRILIEALGHPPRSLAYPYGHADDSVVAAAAAAGYEAAFLFDHRLTIVPTDDPLRLSRLRIDSTATVDRLALIASGIHPGLLQARASTRRLASGATRISGRAGSPERPRSGIAS